MSSSRQSVVKPKLTWAYSLHVCSPPQVLRRHQGTILSVMDTFVHDPLVEWVRAGAKKDADAGNPHAQDALATIQGGRGD